MRALRRAVQTIQGRCTSYTVRQAVPTIYTSTWKWECPSIVGTLRFNCADPAPWRRYARYIFVFEGYTALEKTLTDEFPEESWTKRGVNKLFKKLRDTGSVNRRPGSAAEHAVPALKTRTHQEMRYRTWTFLRRHRTCRGQRLRQLNRLPNFYYNYLC